MVIVIIISLFSHSPSHSSSHTFSATATAPEEKEDIEGRDETVLVPQQQQNKKTK